MAFDVLNVEGADVRGLPLKDRRAVLDRIADRYRIQKSELFFGCGKSLFNAVCEFDLEGIVAKRLNDPYDPSAPNGGRFSTRTIRKRKGALSCSSANTHSTLSLVSLPGGAFFVGREWNDYQLGLVKTASASATVNFLPGAATQMSNLGQDSLKRPRQLRVHLVRPVFYKVSGDNTVATATSNRWSRTFLDFWRGYKMTQ